MAIGLDCAVAQEISMEILGRYEVAKNGKLDINNLKDVCFGPLGSSESIPELQVDEKGIKIFFIKNVIDSLNKGNTEKCKILLREFISGRDVVDLFDNIFPQHEISNVGQLLGNERFRKALFLNINKADTLKYLVEILSESHVSGYENIDPDDISPTDWIFLEGELGSGTLEKLGIDFPVCECLNEIKNMGSVLPGCAQKLELTSKPGKKKLENLLLDNGCAPLEAKVDISFLLSILMLILVILIIGLNIKRLNGLESKFNMIQHSQWNQNSNGSEAEYQNISERLNESDKKITKLINDLYELKSEIKSLSIPKNIISNVTYSPETVKPVSDQVITLYSDSIDLFVSGKDLTHYKDGLYKFTIRGNSVDFIIQNISERHLRNPAIFFSEQYVEGLQNIRMGLSSSSITPGLFEKSPGGSYTLKRKISIR